MKSTGLEPEPEDLTRLHEEAIKHRAVVVGLVWNGRRELLFCRMDPNRGVFPGQWGFPGGGIEGGETMVEALHRELREELGIGVTDVRPAFFKDCLHEKLFPDGSSRLIYMIFLLFHCRAESEELRLCPEFVDYAWVKETDISSMEINSETADTLERLGRWDRLFSNW